MVNLPHFHEDKFFLLITSFNSLIIRSGDTLCMVAPKAISSVFEPGQVKQPAPKYFFITGSDSGYCLITSPILVFFVIFSSSVINSYLLFKFLDEYVLTTM